MREDTKEGLSALMDDEITGYQAEQVMDKILVEENLRKTWERYHLISDVLNNNLSELAVTIPSRINQDARESATMHIDALAERLHQAVLYEPLPFTVRRHAAHIMKSLASFALAASVAMVAILMGVRHLDRDATRDPDFMASTDTSRASGVNTPAGTEPLAPYEVPTRWKAEQSAADARLHSYLVNHSEYLDNGMLGMLPYARIVGQDANR
jgi:sigma-E factor negative regulatory protein RseA